MDTQTEPNSKNNPDRQEDHDNQPGAKNQSEPEIGQESDSQESDQRIAALERELGEIKDRYLRTVAESENVRRRHDRDRADLLRFASEGVIKDILPVLDAFDTALKQSNTAQENGSDANGAEKLRVNEGFYLIHKQLLDALSKQGLEIVDATDVPFDPNVHQAIQMIPKEGATTQTVAAVFAKGYAISGRVIRPAMVSVNVPEN